MIESFINLYFLLILFALILNIVIIVFFFKACNNIKNIKTILENLNSTSDALLKLEIEKKFKNR